MAVTMGYTPSYVSEEADFRTLRAIIARSLS
jgi:hypothetical protein